MQIPLHTLADVSGLPPSRWNLYQHGGRRISADDLIVVRVTLHDLCVIDRAHPCLDWRQIGWIRTEMQRVRKHQMRIPIRSAAEIPNFASDFGLSPEEADKIASALASPKCAICKASEGPFENYFNRDLSGIQSFCAKHSVARTHTTRELTCPTCGTTRLHITGSSVADLGATSTSVECAAGHLFTVGLWCQGDCVLLRSA